MKQATTYILIKVMTKLAFYNNKAHMAVTLPNKRSRKFLKNDLLLVHSIDTMVVECFA